MDARYPCHQCGRTQAVMFGPGEWKGVWCPECRVASTILPDGTCMSSDEALNLAREQYIDSCNKSA